MGELMKEIGGYLDISANWRSRSLDGSPILLNSARNCIRYIAQQRKIKKIYLPYYTCDTVVKALTRENIEIVFYNIDVNFKPLLPDALNNEYILYVNYYGLMDDNVRELSVKHKNMIVDNSQAFFSKPLPGVDTVSSPRKFFGLPDGGVLYTNSGFQYEDLPVDKSSQRVLPLVKRIDYGAKSAYDECLSVRKEIDNLPIMQMSEITQLLLGSIDYEHAIERRRSNWAILDEQLSGTNRIKVIMNDDAVPLFYPYLSDSYELRQHLILNKVYIATYWPGVKQKVSPDSFEYDLVDKMLPLPIDQRYDSEDMLQIIRLLKDFKH